MKGYSNTYVGLYITNSVTDSNLQHHIECPTESAEKLTSSNMPKNKNGIEESETKYKATEM